MKKRWIVAGVLAAVAVIFTVLVAGVDVRPIGPEGSSVGLAGLNGAVREAFPYNATWEKVTDVAGLLLAVPAVFYAGLGLKQLVRRKSLAKVDGEVLALGGLYVALMLVYVVFEKLAINYRPVLVEGVLEASFPSSHTLISLVVCGSAVMVARRCAPGARWVTPVSVIVLALAALIVTGRFLAGVHWCSDILGGVVIAGAMLGVFWAVLGLLERKKEVKK